MSGFVTLFVHSGLFCLIFILIGLYLVNCVMLCKPGMKTQTDEYIYTQEEKQHFSFFLSFFFSSHLWDFFFLHFYTIRNISNSFNKV